MMLKKKDLENYKASPSLTLKLQWELKQYEKISKNCGDCKQLF